MFFEIAGSNVRLGGTMHRVPLGRPLAHWVHGAISWARLIYIEHARQESDQDHYAPPGSQPLVQRLPRSWPCIERKYQRDRSRLIHLSRLRPFAVTADVLDAVPTDEGVEHLVIARSKQDLAMGPRIEYLETPAQTFELDDAVSDTVWDNAVNWSLDNAGTFKSVLEMSYRAWVAGDAEELDQISTRNTRNRFPPIKHAVIVARNRLWLPTIRELAQSTQAPTLVLVGAAHLGGPDGLLAQLAASGLKLTRVVLTGA